MKHLCVMTTVHQPNDLRIIKEIETLEKLGLKITFIAPEGKCPIESVEHIGLKVPSNRLKRIMYSIRRIHKIASAVDADIYHFHDPELIPTAVKLKRGGKKIVYDVHENNPAAILNKEWLPKSTRMLISKSFEKYEERVSESFDGLIVTTENMLRRFSKVARVIILPNYRKGCSESFTSLRDVKDNEIVFVYAGSISPMTCVDEMVRAAYILWERKKDFILKIAGPISDKKLRQTLLNARHPVKYFGQLSRKDAEELVQDSDVGMLLYSRMDKNAVQCSPNKLFEYLSLGKPFIASDNAYWRKKLDQKNPCLYVNNPSDPLEIAEKMEMMLEKKTRDERSRSSIELGRIYTWESIEKDLLDLYKELLSSS